MSYLIAAIALPAIGLAIVCVIGWFPRKALREVQNPYSEKQPDPQTGVPNSKRWYVQSAARFNGRPYSCSFVEFDERGDYLNFPQHQHAYQKIRELTKDPQPLVLVIFVHGWRNHSQSGNVTSFNFFLSQLAGAPYLKDYRVHGVYLSWRGAMFGHTLDASDAHYQETIKHFGGDPLVDLRFAACWKGLAFLVESLFYWSRKAVPEHKSSGTSLSRTVYTCACTARRVYDSDPNKPKPESRVFLIGHSFGGLMVERTVQNAAIGALTDSWPWNDAALPATTNPLPFDSVLCVNSAAPSIYAKQFQSFLAAHRDAMRHKNIRGAGAPIFISVTSEADSATRLAHPAGNCLTPFLPTLSRKYRADDYVFAVASGTEEPIIPQWYYYTHTPGHNPLLVNRFIEPHEMGITSRSAVPLVGEESLFQLNLQPGRRPAGTSLLFHTTSHNQNAIDLWTINMPPETQRNIKWSLQYQNKKPVAWLKDEHDSAYWIVRCPKEIIADHNDIWSQQAMEMYAALYAIAVELAHRRLTPTD